MDDIVERLRQRDSEYVDGRPVTAPDYIALEAAAEIERLRAELADAIKAICRAMASSAERRGRRLRWGSVSMTPLELARDLWAGLENFESEEVVEHVVRALCTQAAVDELNLVPDTELKSKYDLMFKELGDLIRERSATLCREIVGK